MSFNNIKLYLYLKKNYCTVIMIKSRCSSFYRTFGVNYFYLGYSLYNINGFLNFHKKNVYLTRYSIWCRTVIKNRLIYIIHIVLLAYNSSNILHIHGHLLKIHIRYITYFLIELCAISSKLIQTRSVQTAVQSSSVSC